MSNKWKIEYDEALRKIFRSNPDILKQNEFKLSNDKIENFMNNQGNILNSCQNDINNLNNEILKINSYNQNRQGEGLNRDNFMNFIQMKFHFYQN